MAIRKSNPFISIANSYVVDAPEPANISYFWNFGSLLGTCLVIQLATGIFLAMHYSSNLDLAFNSVQHIMIDVNYGWLIRYAHANGAGFFFIFVYLHMARGIYYGSYRKPRIALWTIGVIIFLLMIITAFMGKQNNSPKSKNININKHIRNYSTKIFNKKETDLTNPNEIISEILGNIKLVEFWENLDKVNVKDNIRLSVQQKSGIYIIINKITKNFYIGSASKNRLYTRFSNHLINFHGSKIVHKSVKKYGLNNFIYGILEYVDIDTNSKTNIQKLFKIEITYLSLLSPPYNILTETGNSLGYKHNEENIMGIKASFINERRKLLSKFQKNHKELWSESSQDKLRQISFNRKSDYIKIQLYNLKNEIICEFYSINKAANFLCCSSKIIKRSLIKGYIYIPLPFIPFLTNKNIFDYNSIKNIKNFVNNNKLKSGLLFTNNKQKFYILKKY